MSTRQFRDQKRKEEEHDIKEGQLPAGFSEGETIALDHGSAHTFLMARQSMKEAPVELDKSKDVISKTIRYLADFDTRGDTQATAAKKIWLWETEFPSLKLSKFECAQLLNLRPGSTDEARTLIGSFERFDKDEEIYDLGEALKIITKRV